MKAVNEAGTIYGNDLIFKTLPVYNVTFLVTDEQNLPIENATVSLQNHGFLTTNSQGKVVFSNIEPDTLYFSAEKEGYNTLSHYIIVSNFDVIDTISLSRKMYSVTFFVKDSLDNLIDSALVTLENNGFHYTENNGIAVFENVTPDSLNFTVEKLGFYKFENFVVVKDSDVVEEISLRIKTHNVTFVVKNLDNQPINDVLVSFGNYESLFTNKNGTAIFSNIIENLEISYQLTKDGYRTLVGTCDIRKDTILYLQIEKAGYNVTFDVKDVDNQPLADAIVTLGEFSDTTDNTGKVVFRNVLPAKMGYLVTKNGFISNSDSITISNSDISETVILREGYRVTFEVFDSENKAISGVLVTLGTFGSDSTDATGKAVFENVKPASNLSFTAQKTGFNNFSGTLNVANQDVTLKINLIKTNIPVLEKRNIKISPNPSSGIFNVVAPHFVNEGIVKIFTLTGKKVFETKVQNSEIQLNVGNLPSGAYFLHWENEKSQFIERIIIQK